LKLKQILNRKHPVFKLADLIDWAGFDGEFGAMFCEDFGRPALSTRLMVGLHYLRAAYDESDESARKVLKNFFQKRFRWRSEKGYSHRKKFRK